MSRALFFCEVTSQVNFNSGIQRYTKELAKALIGAGVSLVPVKFGKRGFELLSNEEIAGMHSFNGPQPDQWYLDNDGISSSTFLVYPELPHFDGKEYMSKILFQARRMGLKVVSAFHDASPVLFKKYYTEVESAGYMRYMQGISESDVVISVSQSSKLDYDHVIKDPINKGMRSVGLLSPHCIDKDSLADKVVKEKDTVDLLFVSTFHKRKNHINLLKAFAAAKRRSENARYNIRLTLIGAYMDSRDEGFSNELLGLARAVDANVMVGASEDQLLDAYKSTDIFIYPSFFEGYGFPIAEALSYGVPVLCSNNSSMLEIAEFGGCVTFDPEDIEEMSQAIFNVATKTDVRNKLVNQIKNIDRYDWSNYANDFIIATGLDK